MNGNKSATIPILTQNNKYAKTVWNVEFTNTKKRDISKNYKKKIVCNLLWLCQVISMKFIEKKKPPRKNPQ